MMWEPVNAYTGAWMTKHDGPVTLRSAMGVEVVRTFGTEVDICHRARTSTGSETGETLTRKEERLIRRLVLERHASPFRHVLMTFAVEAPVFVMRELLRHHVGVDPSEASMRYRAAEPVFWVPSPDRKLKVPATLNRMKPAFERATVDQWTAVMASLGPAYATAWETYRYLVDAGVALEVARAVLPVAIFTQAQITLNANAIMNVLARRTHEETAATVSYPQYEIEEVARLMERAFADAFPVTYAAWVEGGRAAL